MKKASPELDIANELLALEPPHPMLPLPSPEQVLSALRDEAGKTQLAELFEFRRAAIANANHDPLRHLLEPEYWGDVRAQLADKIKTIIVLGGNRSGKSFCCAKLVVEAVITHPGTLIVCVSEDEKASIETQQNLVWRFLPPDLKAACHNKRDPQGVFYLNYSEANGFSERKIVLPRVRYNRGNPSKILFATYNESPGDYEGMEFGHAEDWTIAWWADENLRLNWLNMFQRRGKFRPGSGLWSYTPINGITPTIKEAVGKTAVTIKTRQAKLLPDRINVPGLKRGEMPYLQIGALPNSRVFYFHSEMSPFGPGPNGSGKPYAESVAEDCKGKPTEYIKRIAYGYTEDIIGLCYPKFRRDVHVVKPEDLPEEGTNYCYIDPAGERNWFLLWVRVARGNPRRFYIYREWPDMVRYGEWAVPSSRVINQDTRKGWDGDRGPAQRNQGWGVVRYKTLLLTEETIAPTIDSDGHWTEPDPLRRKVLDEAMAGAEIQPLTVSDGRSVWNEAKLDLLRQRHPDPIREPIRLRKLDPRAAVNTQASEKGGTNLVNLFAMETRKSTGELEAPRMTVLPAYTGKGRIDDGVSHVAQLLDYNEDEPVCPVINEPKLYVADHCKQLIWMFENYTSLGGEEGGCKDPADLVRYLAQDDDARHIAPGGKLAVHGNLMSQ